MPSTLGPRSFTAPTPAGAPPRRARRRGRWSPWPRPRRPARRARGRARAPRAGPGTTSASPPSCSASEASVAGGSARGVGAAVQTKRRAAAAQRGEHRARVLVVEDRDDGGEGALRQRRGERGDAARVVRAVQDAQRPLADDLQAAGDLDGARHRGHAVLVERARAPRGRRRGRRRSSCAGSRSAGRPAASPRPARRRRRRAGARGASGAAARSSPRSPRRARARPRRPRRARASRPGATTASFSRAMSATVGPSQRVCSSPTLVSTTTGARSTPVASWRPPSPASTTATSTPRRASSSKAAAVSSSNCVTRSPPASVRSTLAAAAAARSTAAPKAPGERSSSPIRMRSANDVRCGERKAPARVPCASSSAAVMRTVELLPFVPTTCTAREALLRRAERREQAAHALEPEAHPEQLEPEQVLLGLRERPGSQRGELLAQARELVALGLRPRAPAPWPRSRRCRACARRASISARTTPRRCSSRRPAASRSTASEGSTATAPPGTATVAAGSAPSADQSQRASRATCAAVRS